MTLVRCLIIFSLLFTIVPVAFASDPPPPSYLQEARAMMDKASAKAAEVKDYNDEVLIGANFMRNAEAEYSRNLSWSGKLDEKAEPTVRYYSAMARLHAAIVLSRAEKVAREKEQVRLEQKAVEVKAKIKVFDDKNAEIARLKGEVAKRDSAVAELGRQLAERKGEIEQLGAKLAALTADVAARDAALAASETKGSDASRVLDLRQKTIAELERKSAELTKSVEAAQAENRRLKGEMAALAAKKGAEVSESREKLEAANRSQQFFTDVGKLGGMMKTGADSVTAIFPRASLIKASSKSVNITAAGEKLGLALADLLTTYREYRVVIRVHGFGKPVRTEDAGATDQMARLLREVATGKGKLESAAVDALGVGPSEPAYPKVNVEGNRRVELVFQKKQTP